MTSRPEQAGRTDRAGDGQAGPHGGHGWRAVAALLGQTSFSAGAVFAVVYFAGFTSVFFTLSILWQEGLAAARW